jgi:hypothetical protein
MTFTSWNDGVNDLLTQEILRDRTVAKCAAFTKM